MTTKLGSVKELTIMSRTSFVGDGHSDQDLQHNNMVGRITRALVQPNQYRWWHGLALGIAANSISGLSIGNRSQDRRFYESKRQAPFAPPGWAFAPVWAINNISTIWGNLRLLNMHEETPSKSAVVWLQAASWALFSTFSYVYFVKQSPILAFAWTAGMYGVTIASMLLASKLDRKIVLSLASTFLWLSLATIVAGYQMVYNDDPFFGTPAWR
jgi:tryptophan-rich sensory protein